MSTLKVGAIRGVSASSDAVTVANDGTATGKFTNIPLRNLFLNGALLISQRGDSYASANAYTADQWYAFVTGVTAQRLTTSPPAGFTHYIRFPSATSSPIMSQQIELDLQGKAGRFAGKTVTVSWYARSESSNTMYVDAAFKNASGGGDYTSIVSGSSSAQNITSSWARYTQTFTISVDPHANNTCFSIMIRTPSGQGGTLELTGFQAEFGSVATDFEYEAIEATLAKCQRYYFRFTASTSGTHIAMGHQMTSSAAKIILPLPTSMRTRPTAVETTGTASDYSVARTSTYEVCNVVPTFAGASKEVANVNTNQTQASLSTGIAVVLRANTTDFFLGFSAEI